MQESGSVREDRILRYSLSI